MWIEACKVGDIEPEDLIRFDHGGQTFAIYRSEDDEYSLGDRTVLCTHEKVASRRWPCHGRDDECPKHNGCFNYKTGEAKGAPVCVNLRTYPVQIEADSVRIMIG